jgi:hypothetical protein
VPFGFEALERMRSDVDELESAADLVSVRCLDTNWLRSKQCCLSTIASRERLYSQTRSATSCSSSSDRISPSERTRSFVPMS